MKIRKLLLLFILSISIFGIVGCSCSKDKEEEPTPVVTPKLDAATLIINDNVINWNVVNHTTEYDIYRNNTLLGTLTVNGRTSITYTINIDELSDGTYEYYVIGKATGFNLSDHSNTVTYIKETPEPSKLDKVTISINENIISWNKISYETSYEIYKDGVLVDTINVGQLSSFTYTINAEELTEGTYTYYVISKAEGYLNSDNSNTVSFTKEAPKQLDSPIVTQDTLVIRWNEVVGAVSYDIYDGDNVIKNINVTYVSYSDLELSVGEHNLYVVAKGDKDLDSSKSKVINYTQNKKVVSLDVTCSKTEYKSGEYFDLSSLTVIAYYNDGTTELVSDPIVNICETLQPSNTEVIVSYGKVGYHLPITVKNEGLSVSEAKLKALNESFNLEGIVVGVGATAYVSMLIVKDVNTNDIIGVTGCGTNTATSPSYGSFAKGDRIVMPVTVSNNESNGLSNYLYTCAFAGSEAASSYIISKGNSTEFDKSSVKTISNQEELNNMFLTQAEGEKWGYSFVKLTGHIYFVNYGSDYSTMYSRIVFDNNSTDNRIKCEGFTTRAISPVFRNNYTNINTGKTFSELVYGCTSISNAKKTYTDKYEFYGDIYAVVCGSNSYYIQFIVLNESDVEAQETAVKEVRLVTPSKTTYSVGEELVYSDGYIETEYEDGNIEVTSIVSTCVTTDYNKDVAGTYTVTIKYGSFEESYQVTVE